MDMLLKLIFGLVEWFFNVIFWFGGRLTMGKP